MPSARHEQISRLFIAASEMPADAREAFLDSQCSGDPSLRREVDSLLIAALRDESFLKSSALGGEFHLSEQDPHVLADQASDLPRTIGRYRIIRLIAHGGVGAVFEAEQDKPQRRVAIKVLRFGAWSATVKHRFELESQVLARLHHPAIAEIYEAGTHRHHGIDLPYIAMRYVDGRRITEAADEMDLSTEQRIDLFLLVCDAVQHAHQHGVIHRDLKPDNILVDADGKPMILDFGVALLVGEQSNTYRTIAGQILGTLGYMSPEQFRSANVDTRSDVYSLGVILYKLLSGRLPHDVLDKPLSEAAHIVDTEHPTALGTINRSLRGDIETIVAKALNREPDRRYASAGEFAEDLRRHKRGEIILARRASTMYQLRRFGRRHPGLSSAVIVFVIMLAITAVVSTVLATRAIERQREADLVSRFLLDVFLGSPDVESVSRLELLYRADRQLLANPISDPRVEATIREYIGHGYHKLNQVARAEPHLARAVEIRRKLGTVDEECVKSFTLLGMQRVVQGEVAQASSLFSEALALRRRLLGPDHAKTPLDGELLYFATLYAPNEPEVLADRESRRAMASSLGDSSALVAIDGDWPSVLSIAFGEESLNDDWTIELERVESWDYSINGDRIVFNDIQTVPASDGGVSRGTVRIAHRLPQAVGNFRVDVTIGWDTQEILHVMQYCGIELYGPSRTVVAQTYYTDGWLRHQGGRSARISEDPVLRNIVATGHDTAPAEGSARVSIIRRDGLMTILWNGVEFLRGANAHELSEIHLVAGFTDSGDSLPRSLFGTLWFESVEIRGMSSSNSTDQE